ncbi:MAG: DUF5067 domain-containing protein [Lachnospiraceae bacterium]
MKKELEGERKQIRRRKKKASENGMEESSKRQVRPPQEQPSRFSDADQRRHERHLKQRSKTVSIIILCVEFLILGAVIYGLVYFSLKLKNGDFQTEKTEQAAVSEGAEGSDGSVNVNNDNFSLTCTKVQLTTDIDGNPAALIYFTFVNKTDTPLSLGEVFPPKVVQDGVDCETFASLESPPDELYNKDIQIQDGASIEACYSVKLQNTASELTLSIHDNYETFTDIGSTTIPLE